MSGPIGEVRASVRTAWQGAGHKGDPPWGFGYALKDFFDLDAARFIVADDGLTVLGIFDSNLLIIEPVEDHEDQCTIRPVAKSDLTITVEYRNRWHVTERMTGPEFVGRATIEADDTYTVTSHDRLDWIRQLLGVAS